jgi:hypothetical protein
MVMRAILVKNGVIGHPCDAKIVLNILPKGKKHYKVFT